MVDSVATFDSTTGFLVSSTRPDRMAAALLGIVLEAYFGAVVEVPLEGHEDAFAFALLPVEVQGG